ncbi:hypothetical protein CBR_g4868 [Chara braunii]|uniref:Uncharacterized protein n=1 Tax=Chara braunii TaxID=69332 RepID=A0A388KJ09_CHABU|nr:hypothetical protein CBR_g4868 [Chara braunii]|eukprot:GBG70040.1 hypothetical protein CBR_g4868 [Chara braunii]
MPRALSAEDMFPESPDSTRPSQRLPDIGPLIPPEFENEVVVVNVEKPTRDGVQSKSLRFRLDSTVAVAITAQAAWEFLTLAFKVLFCIKVALQTVFEVTKCVLQGWIGIIPLGFATGVALARIMAGVRDEEGVLEAEEDNRPKDPRTLYVPPKLQVWLFSLGIAFWALKFLGPMSGGHFGYFVAHVGTGGLWELYALFRGVVHGGQAGPPSEMAVRKAMGI